MTLHRFFGPTAQGGAITLILSLLAACQTASTYDPNALTFDTAHYHTGVETTRPVCETGAFSVWVSADGDGFCLRYFPSFGVTATDIGEAIVFFHGDLTYQDVELSYPKLTANRFYNSSVNWYQALDKHYILFSRPGTFGSTGFHPDRRYRDGREGRIINAALSAIAKRHGIGVYHLAGHSGGANVVAQALEYRDDVKCAVMAAGAMSLRDAFRRHAMYSDFDLFIGTKYNPIDHIERVRKDPKRRVFILFDPKDQIAEHHASRAYAKALAEHGHEVALVEGTAGGDAHHDMDHTARHMAGDCADSLTNSQIADKARARRG